MSIIITNPIVLLTMQLLTLAGFLILTFYTFISYKRIKNQTLLFISLAFAFIAITILFEILLLFYIFPLIEEEYLESIIESIQFLAAFFFFLGLRIVKRKVKESES